MFRAFLCVLACASLACAQAVPWTPSRALQRALDVYPEVLASGAQLEGAQAYAEGAGAMLSPSLQLAATLGDADENSNTLRQRVELGGQRGLRSDLSQLDIQAAQADLGTTQRTVAIRTGSAYYALWTARERLRLGLERVRLAQQLEDIARKRLASEEIAANEYQLVQLESARARARQLDVAAEERIARSRLNLFLGLSDEESLELPAAAVALPEAPLYLRDEKLELAALQERAESTRTDLARARLEADSAALEADLVAAERSPDLEFSAYRSRLYGAAEQGVQLAVVIPLWDWGRISAQEARQRKRAEALARLVDVRRREIRLQVREAWERYRAAREKRELLREQAQRAASLAQTGQKAYALGFMSLVQVLQTQTAFLDVLLDWIDAEGKLQQTALELHWTAGGQNVGEP